MQTTTRKEVKAAPAVRGSVRWIKRLVGNGFGRLVITSHTKRGPVTAEYDVEDDAQ
jgi:hypothetical protein